MHEASERYRRCGDTVCTESGGETILVRLSDGCFFGLGQTGTLIWNRLAQPATSREVIEFVERACGPLPEGAAAELTAFLHELRQEKLLDPVMAGDFTAPIPGAPAEKHAYVPPRLERGSLRQAASGMSTWADGGLTECGGPDGAS